MGAITEASNMGHDGEVGGGDGGGDDDDGGGGGPPHLREGLLPRDLVLRLGLVQPQDLAQQRRMPMEQRLQQHPHRQPNSSAGTTIITQAVDVV